MSSKIQFFFVILVLLKFASIQCAAAAVGSEANITLNCTRLKMNFKSSKENIQPLGRNIECVEVAIKAVSHPKDQQELIKERKQFKQIIANYKGDDPLNLWFEYLSRIEESYPRLGKESALQACLTKCLSKFESDDRYTQDPRLVRIFIKYIDSQKEPQRCYQKMYNKGVGTMVADLYVAWAHYYDAVDNYDLAEQVYQKGIAARATPADQLKQALEIFHFSISQRALGKDDFRQEFLISMQERRNAFTSLRSYKSSMIGSIRTDSAASSQAPSVKLIPSLATSSKNLSVNIYEGSSNETTSNPKNSSNSVVEDIKDSIMEGEIEPGPWSHASKAKKYATPIVSTFQGTYEAGQPKANLPADRHTSLNRKAESDDKTVNILHCKKLSENHISKRGLVGDNVNTKPPLKKRNSNNVTGTHTGALRKSSIAKNATHHDAAIVSGLSAPSYEENALKSTKSFYHEKAIGKENADVDYNLFIQNANARLREQMVRTPFRPRSQEVLQKKIINPKASSTQKSNELSIISETSEGSSINNFKSYGADKMEKDCSEKSFALPFKIYEDPVQIDVKTNVSQSTNQHFKSSVAVEYCNDEASMQTVPFPFNLATSKFIDQTMAKQSSSYETENVPGIRKHERTIEKESVEPYPFPIFEDASSTNTTTNTTPHSRSKDSPTQDPEIITHLSNIRPTVSKNPFVVSNANTPDCLNRSEANLRKYHSRLELPSLHVKVEPEESVIIVSPTELSPNSLDDDHQQSLAIPKIDEIQCLALDEENNMLSIPDWKEDLCVKETSNEFNLSVSFDIEELNLNSFKDTLTDTKDPKSSFGKTFEIRSMTALANDIAEYDDEVVEIVDSDEEINCDQSLYFKHNSTCVKDFNSNEVYEFNPVNLEEAKIIIDTKLAQPSVDPFDLELRNAILDKVDMISFLQNSDTCQLVSEVPPLSVNGTIKFKDMQFDVVNVIGQGAYGRVFSVTSRKDGKMHAVMPANLWEYYICTEVHHRIASDRMLHGYMNINYGIVGNNGSLLFSEYSSYGTLTDVCNRLYTSWRLHVDESIVFILVYQMLDVIDHLHGSGILHMNLKPENFLIMKKLSSDCRDLFIQLIDFGNAVDLKQFANEQEFNATFLTKHICIEMMEQRPWIHQPDLFCLAGTVHSVLFGSCMEVEKKFSGNYEIKLKIKPCFNQTVWKKFFKRLINVDCGICENWLKPDLQEIKEMFFDAIENDKNLLHKIKQFNSYIEPK